MKYVVLCALIAVARATVLAPAVVPVAAAVSTGASVQHHSQDTLGNYQFGYTEGHATGGTFRKESGDAFGNKVGSYGLSDADGRQRIVNYVADAAGFRADIKTNEPGVDASQDPASTTINKDAVVVAAPVAVAAAAPVAVAAAAPVAVAAAAPVAAVAAAPFHYAAPAFYHHAFAGFPAYGGYSYHAHVPGVYSYSTTVGHPGAYSYSATVGHHGLAYAAPAFIKG